MKLLLCLSLVCLQSKAADYFCYLPGAGGLTEYMKNEVPKQLNSVGVPFIAFDIGKSGTVQERAQIFLNAFEQVLEEDNSAKCHLFGFSMGGLVSRWLVNHADINGVPFKNFVLSQSSSSSPHYGTPLARLLRRYWSNAAPGVEQLSEENVRQFNDPSSGDFSPVVPGIPFYSYRTYIESKHEAGGLLNMLGYQLIVQEHDRLGIETLNDGIVPTKSQGFGTLLGDIHASHGYFKRPTDYSIHLVDFFQAHWNFLTKGTKPLVSERFASN